MILSMEIKGQEFMGPSSNTFFFLLKTLFQKYYLGLFVLASIKKKQIVKSAIAKQVEI